MDWEYYIDNDFSNSIVRATFLFFAFRGWYKYVVKILNLNNRI